MLITIIFFILFLIMTAVTIIVAVMCGRRVKGCKITTGKIAEINKWDSYAYGNCDQVSVEVRVTTIEYTANGKVYKFRPSSFKRSDKVGDEVKIAYKVSDPAKAFRYGSLKMAPIITGVIAAAFLACTVVCLAIVGL